MAWLFQPLLMLLARSTDSQLARQVEFLHAENQMLRRRLTKRVRLSVEEKWLLVKLGEAMGQKAVSVLLTVVAYSTYRRYVGQIDPSRLYASPRGTEEAGDKNLSHHGDHSAAATYQMRIGRSLTGAWIETFSRAGQSLSRSRSLPHGSVD